MQKYRLFEKVAQRDRERQLSELQKREESRSVPQAVQELEITSETPQETEEPSREPAQAESSTVDAGAASELCQTDSCPDPGQLAEEDQAAAGSTNSAEE